MRIIVFVINALVQFAAATVGLLLLLLGLNGFGERQATPGLVFYVVLGVASALGLGVASAFTAQRLAQKSSFGNLGASAAAVVVFAILGVLILVVGFFAAVIIAEAVRGMR
jgi:hypothetical protein